MTVVETCRANAVNPYGYMLVLSNRPADPSCVGAGCSGRMGG